MRLTLKQTDLIIKKLRDYLIEIVDLEDSDLGKMSILGEEYFNEKVNEALEDFNKKQLKLDELYDKIPKELRDLVSEIVELEIEREEECGK